MRKTIALVAALFGAASGIACGGDGGGDLASADPFCQRVVPAVEAFMTQARADHPTPSDDRYGGTVVVGGAAELRGGMNSAGGVDYVSVQHHQFVNLMTLIDYDQDAEPRAYLAERWEVSEDVSEITFHLRQDVFWHDGEQTDAHDVAFTYGLVTNPVVAFSNPAYWDHYEQGEQAVEVVDDFTIKIRMRAHVDFLDPWRTVGVLPEHLLGDVPPDSLRTHPFGTECPVGNGPFVFASHTPQDRWVFTANPAFPEGLGGRPFLDQYVYRVIGEQTTSLTELLTQSTDVYLSVPPDQAQRIIDDPAVDLMHFRSRNFAFVAWNSRKPQLAAPEVRRALTLGTNRRGVIDAMLHGYAGVANSGVPPLHWAFDRNLAALDDYDPEAAATLLEEAGWTDRDGDGVREDAEGTPLTISVKYRSGAQLQKGIVEIMQSQLGQIGVGLRPEAVEWTTLLRQTFDVVRDFDGLIMQYAVDYRLDDTDSFHSARSDVGSALSGTSDQELDGLLERLSSAPDREVAQPLWTQYQRVLNEVHPYTFLYFPERIHGISKRLRGVEMDARAELLNIKDWHLDPASR